MEPDDLRPGREPAPSRLLVAALAVVTVLELVAGGIVVRRRDDLVRAGAGAGGRGETSVEASARRRVLDEREAAVRALLDERSRAVITRDRALFLRGIDPAATGFRERQGRVFDALAEVPIASWEYVLDAGRETPYDASILGRYATETWVPEIHLEYRLAGFDDEPTTGAQFLTFVRRPDGWRLANDDDFPGVPNLQTDRELWDFGPVAVVQTAHALVLGRPNRRELMTRIARQVERSIPRVTAVWGRDWSQRVVVLVPETQEELGTIIEEGNDLSQIAAVAVAQLSAVPDGLQAAGNRVIVNPPNFARLSANGRAIVLQHEITHVATREHTGFATPTWLVEGFADYVGYLDSPVRTRDAARELRAEVRRGVVPSDLPGEDDFRGTAPRLAQTYEMAWLACRLIAEQTSQADLVRFYRAVGDATEPRDAAVDTAFREVLSSTRSSFVRAWQAYLRAQLG
ncbi:MAG TPA: hypothetical protein VNA14_13440 [Mycobacteriales bacterium]|nr:hypothetical protein [Mycobacteriales bacterium]